MKKLGSLVIGGLAAVSMGIAAAELIFTWIDRDGVTHYSETPPTDNSIESFQIELEQATAAGPAADDGYFSVVNQASHMEKSRLANEKVRTERLQAEAGLRRAAAADQPQVSNQEYDTNRYYPAYPFYGYRPGFHQGFNPGRHPGHRPVQLPEPGHNPGRSRPISRVH